METILIQESMLIDGCLKIPLCKKADTKKDFVLTCYQNPTDKVIPLVVEDTVLTRPILPHDSFTCVLRSGQFCMAEKTLRLYGNALRTTEDDALYVLNKQGKLERDTTPSHRFCNRDTITRTDEGVFLLSDYPVPLVYAHGDIGIHKNGKLFLQEHITKGLRKTLLEQHRYFMALYYAELVLTSHRQALCLIPGRKRRMHRGKPCPDTIDLCCNDTGNFALTAKGQVFYSITGEHWEPLLEDMTAFATNVPLEDLVAADRQGCIWLCQWDASFIPQKPKLLLEFRDKQICELELSSRLLAIRFSDGSFCVYDREQKRICFPPEESSV